MITPKLEELILCGEAEYRTCGMAYSSNYKLVIPDNSVLIVTDIVWNNFLQSPFPDPTLQEFFAFNAYQVRFYDTNRKYNHIHFRNSIKVINSNNNNFTSNDKISTFLNRGLLLPEPALQVHCFFVYKKLLQVNLIMHEIPKNLIYGFTKIVDSEGLTDKVPIDAGTGVAGLNTVVYVENPATGTDVLQYYPQGLQFTPVPPPASRANQEFVELNDQRYQLQNPSGLTYPNIATPLFTIGYVLVRDEKIFSKV